MRHLSWLLIVIWSLLSIRTVLAQSEELQKGALVELYQLKGPLNGLPQLFPNQAPNQAFITPAVAMFEGSRYRTPFDQMGRHFFAEVSGYLKMSTADTFQFRLSANEGARIFIDDSLMASVGPLMAGMPTIDGTGSLEFRMFLDTELHPFRIEYFNQDGAKTLLWEWYIAGIRSYAEVPQEVLRCQTPDENIAKPGFKRAYTAQARAIPGDAWSVDGLHPSLNREAWEFPGFAPRVGGMDRLPDGSIAIATFDGVGAVYLWKEQDGAEPSLQRIATGLAEPMGLKVVDGNIYVLQRQELTQLIDINEDGIIDEFRLIAGGWACSPNERELAGALNHDGRHFYVSLAAAADKDGRKLAEQLPQRGSILKVSSDGSWEEIATDAFAPLGLYCQGDQVWYTDVQAIDQPASTVHLAGQAQPVVWLPRNLVAEVPTDLTVLRSGPFENQLVVADLAYGGLRRIAPEMVNGQWQGAAFRFSQGFEGGISRLLPTEDGFLVGRSYLWKGWDLPGHLNAGLEQITFAEGSTFEMSRITARSNGISIEFSEAIAPGYGERLSDYRIMGWEPNSGGAQLLPIEISGLALSEDRRRLDVQLSGLKAGMVLFVRILQPFPSEDNQSLWSTEAWYNMNQVPSGKALSLSLPDSTAFLNSLSEAEKAAGWDLLFDGTTTEGFRSFREKNLASGWQVVDGALTLVEAGAGYLVTDQAYEHFELSVEWNLVEGGNSGIFFHVSEEKESVWTIAPEYQLLDDLRHPDNQLATHRAGSDYDLMAPAFEALNPPGTYNRTRIIVDHGKVQHWLNGYLLLQYELGSEEWAERVANSKFAPHKDFGKAGKGVIAFQDHGDRVSFRNLKIRQLK
ncbi:MAG: family 16 glycoside hydrolase [Bacteroidota bacterium]